MNNNPEQETVYRYFTLGCRGTITLNRDTVQIKSSTSGGNWDQTIPLEAMSSKYGTLKVRPQGYFLAWFIALLFASLGGFVAVWPTSFFITIYGIVVMLGCGACMVYLIRHRKCEWFTFQTHSFPDSIHYTRQGPDEQRCDEFTQLLVERIRDSSDVEK